MGGSCAVFLASLLTLSFWSWSFRAALSLVIALVEGVTLKFDKLFYHWNCPRRIYYAVVILITVEEMIKKKTSFEQIQFSRIQRYLDLELNT